MTWSFSYSYAKQKIDDRKNAPTLLAISMSASPSMAGLGLPYAVIGQVFVPYRPGGHHGHRFWRKTLSCGVVEIAF